MLYTCFKFHPIGQGCFYTGKIRLNKPKFEFTFVYDCGTYSRSEYLEKEIDKYKEDLHNSYLDLLMISHFDADHVNGVVRLMQGVEVGRLIIPYIKPIERLLLYTSSNDPDDDYRLFLQDPLSFLSSRFKINEILIVGRPGDDEPEVNENSDDIPPPNFDKFPLENIKEIGFDYGMVDWDLNTALIKQVEKEDGSELQGANISFLRRPYYFKFSIWEFIFYLKKHDNYTLINHFNNDVNYLLNYKGIELRDLFSAENIAELKDYYKRFGTNINETSLVTYHGPLINTDKNVRLEINAHDYFHNHNHPKCGTVLTGDISLKGQRNTQKLLNYFRHRMQDVVFFQVPHHGSENNWNLNHPNGYDNFQFYVINHGSGRSKHPSVKVIDYIKQHCQESTLYSNNEYYGIRYEFDFL